MIRLLNTLGVIADIPMEELKKTLLRVFLLYLILDVVEGGGLNPFGYVDAPGKY